jgi:riboflavin synthase
MFTGIVQGLGLLKRATSGEVEIAVPDHLRSQLGLGDSVAVNGVCLTVRRITDNGFVADLSRETASRTGFGRLRTGARLNLERALPAGGGLDGHLVLGHIDTVGRVQAFFREGEGWVLIVGYPPSFSHLIAEKGSIAVDGISLTPFRLEAQTFRCAIIPETVERTNLQGLRAGDPVNLEFDVLAKYVERMMQRVHPD